ncbi:hypothetical protein ACOMHN_033685 [Nucella lapillus]
MAFDPTPLRQTLQGYSPLGSCCVAVLLDCKKLRLHSVDSESIDLLFTVQLVHLTLRLTLRQSRDRRHTTSPMESLFGKFCLLISSVVYTAGASPPGLSMLDVTPMGPGALFPFIPLIADLTSGIVMMGAGPSTAGACSRPQGRCSLSTEKSSTLVHLCRRQVFRHLCVRKQKVEVAVSTFGLPEPVRDYLLFPGLEPHSHTLNTLFSSMLA